MQRAESGFSMIEVVFALVIIMIALLGVMTVFTYSIQYNQGNKTRSLALAVLQQEVERYRAAKFNSSATDNFTPGSPDDGRRDLTGGTKAQRFVTTTDGNQFSVDVTVDNDPSVAGVQNETYVCLSPQGTALSACTVKEVTIRVNLAAPSPGWRTAVPATVVMERSRGN
ncbi:MAG TPA: prepilin-type N-terminal cleavage/methylation domain-containing protein [Pyrinomonadaceae bacterium]